KALALDVEGDVPVVGELVEKVRGVRHLVAAAAVIGRAHIGAHADALARPELPLAIGVVADGNDGKLAHVPSNPAGPMTRLGAVATKAIADPQEFSAARHHRPPAGCRNKAAFRAFPAIWRLAHTTV